MLLFPLSSITSTTGAALTEINKISNGIYTDYTNIGSGTQDIIFDYGEEKIISSIKIWMYYSDGRTFRNVAVYGKILETDVWTAIRFPSDWTAIADGLELTLPQNTKYRYLRFYSEGNYAYNSNEYNEIEVYTEDSIDRALNKECSSSSIYDSSYIASYANDGNANTRWSSNTGDSLPFWAVNLIEKYYINKAIIKWEAANATAYNIEYSDNNVDWTVCYIFTNGTDSARTDHLSWNQITAHKYWRVNVETKGSFALASIYSIELYGDPDLTIDANSGYPIDSDTGLPIFPPEDGQVIAGILYGAPAKTIYQIKNGVVYKVRL